jgi:8-oxo-dGTP diphosphatase
MGIQRFESLAEARDWAAENGLREKAVCFVLRGPELLVFGHIPAEDSGVQLPAGGVEANETPQDAAIRELYEEAGLQLTAPLHLRSYEWQRQLPDRFIRQVCHAYVFTVSAETPDAWTRHADDHLFAFRWMPAIDPQLDWDMDAALPELHTHLLLQESE